MAGQPMGLAHPVQGGAAVSSAHDGWREIAAAEARRNRMHPWRKVVGHRVMSGHFGCNTGAYSYVITLECGHEGFRKGSQGLPKKMRCLECPPAGDQPGTGEA